MRSLNDDCWLIIFKRLNLNERRAVRLACKRFRALCDSIKIDKLVIFERQQPRSGRLQHTNEPYGLEHTAYVVNLRRFFTDEQIVSQMRPIQALAIHGTLRISESAVVDLKVKFEQLNFLELHCCVFLNSTLLSSAKLEYLIFDCAFLRSIAMISAKEAEIKAGHSDDSRWFYSLGLDGLRSRRLKYFSVNHEIDGAIPQVAFDSHLFDRLEEADLYLPHLVLVKLVVRNGQCPMLKRLNVMIGWTSVEETVRSIEEADLDRFLSIFSEHLTINLYGFPLNRQHASVIIEFFRPFGRKIRVSLGRFHLQIDLPIYKHIKKWARNRDLSQFCQLVSEITVVDSSEQLNADRKFFTMFTRCCSIRYLAKPIPAHLDMHVDVLANLKNVLLSYAFEHPPIDNKLLRAIGKKKSLEILWFNSFEKIHFGVLFKLQCLRSLKMRLVFAPPQCTLIDLMKNTRDLAALDVCFIRSNSESRAKLSEFRKRMNETFSERFKARGLEFRVEIHTKLDQFVRYLLFEVHERTEMPDKTNMFWFIEHKKAQMGRKAFKKAFGQPAIDKH